MTKQVTASDAKNNFGGLLEDVAALGRVDILKHGRLVAVMLSPQAFAAADSAGIAGQDDQAGQDERWGKNHMIPPARARSARMVGSPGTFDDD